MNVKLILDFIKSNKLTIREFCKSCHIGTTTFYKIINGKDFEITALFKIAKRMNMPVHLFFAEDAKSETIE